MRFSTGFIVVGLIVTSLAAPAAFRAQSQSIGAPALGFLTDSSGRAIWPIAGVAGAAVLGERLSLDLDVLAAVISPSQDYAVALQAGASQTVVIDLASGTTVPVSGAAGADLIAISPTGAIGALYDNVSATVQVIGNLPNSPAVTQRFDAAGISGLPSSLAISDDGRVALIQFETDSGASLWKVSAAGPAVRILFDSPTSAAFFPNREDAVIADDATQIAFVLKDILNSATPVPLISFPQGMNRFSNISISDDGRRVFLADAGSGNIAIVDVQTRASTITLCSCKISGFNHLKGTSIFRLSEISSGMVMVLDAAIQPRIVAIPSSINSKEVGPLRPRPVIRLQP